MPQQYLGCLQLLLSQHGAVQTDGTGWAVDFSLRPRPLSRGSRRTVVPFFGSNSHCAALLEDEEADPDIWNLALYDIMYDIISS